MIARGQYRLAWLLLFAVSGCASPTEPNPSGPSSDTCPVFTVCWKGPDLPLPPSGPEVAVITGRVLIGASPLAERLPYNGQLLMTVLQDDTLPVGIPLHVDVGFPGYSLDVDEYRIPLDSARAALGGCTGLVRILEPIEGRVIETALLPAGVPCEGDVTGVDLSLPELVPIRVSGVLADGGVPVGGSLTLRFSVAGFSAYVSEWTVASDSSSAGDGSFDLEGMIPGSACGQVDIRMDTTLVSTLTGCGDHVVDIDID